MRRARYAESQQSCARVHVVVAAASTMEEGSSPDSIVPMGYAAYALEERLRQDHVESLQEYAALQDQLLKRTQRAGTFLAGYLLLTVSGKAALATLVGTLASYAYLRWLMHDMAALSQSSVAPFQEARAQQSQPTQTLLLGLAAYRQALKPRLLVPVSLAAGMAAYNHFVQQQPLQGIEQASLLAGFLSYKAALLLNVWDDTKPKFDAKAGKRPRRPDLAVLPDVKDLETQRDAIDSQ